MEGFDIPKVLYQWIIDSWKLRTKDLLARFDYLINERGELKLIEINADTPTLLLESAYA